MSMIGKTLAHYEITSQLGKGGMGEVYQAKDRKLGRNVAIKVLPEEFAKDTDRIARFQREAKLLASLNHPNIAAIHGLEESGGTNFLVLELVEGETLADQIKRGPIPVEESLKLALQIAEALEAAHEKSIIHRDLKPANIKVTPDGKVKVLDFGLAKAFAGDQTDLSPSNSPTLTRSPMLSDMATQQGVILGTAAYMSPEQARGKAVDKRADIWAFGCVLYEMLTGQAAFQGEDVTEILAAVVKSGANLDLLPANLHPRLHEVITRCLQKDLKRRYSSITDARYEIEQALADPSGVFVQAVTTAKPRKRLRLGLAWIAGAVVLAAIITGVAVWKLKPTVSPEPIRFTLNLGDSGGVALSPDGHYLAFKLRGADGVTRLGVRALDSLETRPLLGTESIGSFFWSPDSRFIAFGTGGKLKKINVSEGSPQELCDLSGQRLTGGSWNRDGVIIFGLWSVGLMRVSSAGGVPSLLTKLNPSRKEYTHIPAFLPDGRHFLYLAYTLVKSENRGVFTGSLDAKPEEQLSKQVLAASEEFIYQPSGDSSLGHLLFLRERTLMAQQFDDKRLELVGDPVLVAEQVAGSISASINGVLIYGNSLSRDGATVGQELVWMDRQGKKIRSASPPGAYRNFRLSGDGKKIVFDNSVAGSLPDIWVLDLIRSVSSRLTSDPAIDNLPIWFPDGLRVLFPSNRNGSFDLYIKAATGAGQEETLIKLGTPTGWGTDWSKDGRFILYQIPGAKTGQDLWIAPQFGDRKPSPYLQTRFSEQAGVFSPDGHWIAYVSDESGRDEIYVQSFPLSDSKFLISTGGGSEPYWRKDGTELFYIATDHYLMTVPIKFSPAFEPGPPKRLISLPASAGQHSYAVSGDGQQFLVVNLLAGETAQPVTVVVNWQTVLKK